jgi:hypothetical protein
MARKKAPSVATLPPPNAGGQAPIPLPPTVAPATTQPVAPPTTPTRRSSATTGGTTPPTPPASTTVTRTRTTRVTSRRPSATTRTRRPSTPTPPVPPIVNTAGTTPATPRATPATPPRRSVSKRIWWAILGLLILIAGLAGLWYLFNHLPSWGGWSDKNKKQAVTLGSSMNQGLSNSMNQSVSITGNCNTVIGPTIINNYVGPTIPVGDMPNEEIEYKYVGSPPTKVEVKDSPTPAPSKTVPDAKPASQAGPTYDWQGSSPQTQYMRPNPQTQTVQLESVVVRQPIMPTYSYVGIGYGFGSPIGHRYHYSDCGPRYSYGSCVSPPRYHKSPCIPRQEFRGPYSYNSGCGAIGKSPPRGHRR